MPINRGLKRKSKAQSEIPSSSLADMAFLLLIFFMVSTTFRKEEPRVFTAPEAEATEKRDEPRKDVLHVYIEPDGSTWINDAQLPMDQVSEVVRPLYAENRALVIQLRADRDVPYSTIDQVQKELQQAGAVRLVFFTLLEQRVTRERR
jgi:biopolymer transport protein ExbD